MILSESLIFNMFVGVMAIIFYLILFWILTIKKRRETI